MELRAAYLQETGGRVIIYSRTVEARTPVTPQLQHREHREPRTQNPENTEPRTQNPQNTEPRTHRTQRAQNLKNLQNPENLQPVFSLLAFRGAALRWVKLKVPVENLKVPVESLNLGVEQENRVHAAGV